VFRLCSHTLESWRKSRRQSVDSSEPFDSALCLSAASRCCVADCAHHQMCDDAVPTMCVQLGQSHRHQAHRPPGQTGTPPFSHPLRALLPSNPSVPINRRSASAGLGNFVDTSFHQYPCILELMALNPNPPPFSHQVIFLHFTKCFQR
jgi:hypothetical protein